MNERSFVLLRGENDLKELFALWKHFRSREHPPGGLGKGKCRERGEKEGRKEEKSGLKKARDQSALAESRKGRGGMFLGKLGERLES